MQMPAVMEKRWLAVVRLASRSLTIDADGVSLGKTLLAPFRDGELVIDKARITAMLSVAYDREVPFKTQSLRHAERCYKNGDVAMAQMHLALCGLQTIDLDQAQRLFVAEWALANHVPPRELLKLAGIGKFNPNHIGPGPRGGQFTSDNSTNASFSERKEPSENNTPQAVDRQSASNAYNAEVCRAKCSDLALPTKDFGISFRRCYNQCMGTVNYPEWAPFF